MSILRHSIILCTAKEKRNATNLIKIQPFFYPLDFSLIFQLVNDLFYTHLDIDFGHYITLVHTHKKETALNKLLIVPLNILQIQMSTLRRHLHFHACCSVVHDSQGIETT